MFYDYHVHSSYSDGSDMGLMVAAAEQAGLAGVGFTDHCDLSTLEDADEFHFARTYERRRQDIEAYREKTDLEIFDAVEVDYYPGTEGRIREFLDEASFDYALGSVHQVDGVAVMESAEVDELDETERRELVADYFEILVELIESELFDVVAHLDVVERNARLRGLATAAMYEQVVEAFEHSASIPEVNAGRVFDDLSGVHPGPDLLDSLVASETQFVAGSDSHTPEELVARADPLLELFTERNMTPVELPHAPEKRR